MPAMLARRNVRVGSPSSLHRRNGHGRSARLRILAVAIAAAPLAITAPAWSRDLTPEPVKTAPALEYSPAADGPWLGWSRQVRGSSDYFVRKGGEPRVRVNAKDTSADGGGIYRRTLVYTQCRRKAPCDLYRFDLRTGRRAPLPDKVNSPGSQFGPSLSGRYLLFTRLRDYPHRGVEFSKVMLYDRKGGSLRVLAIARFPYSEIAISHSVEAGQVNGAYAVWQRGSSQGGLYRRRGNVVRLNIRRDVKTTLPRPEHTLQYSPSVSSDGTVYFVRESKPDGTRQIVKKPVGVPAEVLYTAPTGDFPADLFVDDRAKARQVYFSILHGRSRDIYKLIDRLPSL